MADDKTKGAGNAAADAAATAGDASRQAGDTVQGAASAMSDTGTQLGLKMLDQAEQNTREAFNAMRAAAQAKDLGEVMRIQSDYMREQGSRAVAQAREIGELIANFGRAAMNQMTGRR